MLLRLVRNINNRVSRQTRTLISTISRPRKSSYIRIREGIISTSITLDIVRVSPILLSSNRYVAKEGSKQLLSLDSTSVIISIASKVNSTIGVNNKGLKIRQTLGKQLISIESYISNNQRIVVDASTKDYIIQGLIIRI